MATLGPKELMLRAQREAKAGRAPRVTQPIVTPVTIAAKRAGGRPKVRASGADRQRAYRERRKA